MKFALSQDFPCAWPSQKHPPPLELIAKGLVVRSLSVSSCVGLDGREGRLVDRAPRGVPRLSNGQAVCIVFSLALGGVGMTIVFIADEPYQGGGPECMMNLIEHLIREHFVHCIVCTVQRSAQNDRLEAAGAHTVVTGHAAFLVSPPDSVLNTPRVWIKGLVKYLRAYSSSIAIAERSIDFSRVDLIHSNSPRNDLGLALAKKHGIPHVCHLRELSFQHFRCWSYRRDPIGYLNDGTSMFVAISNAVCRGWVARGCDAAKCQMIFDGVDTSDIEPRVVSCERAGRRLRVLFLGGCSIAKGTFDAIGALAELTPDERKRIHLDIVGSSSRYSAWRSKKTIRDNCLEDVVSIADWNKDVHAVLPEYDVGLVCSRAEGFGRVVIEFQAAGLVVIGANTGAIPELVHEGETGLLYDKNAGPASLGKRLKDILDGSIDMEGISKKSVEASRRFAAYDSNESVYAMYQCVLEGTRQRL